MLTHEEDKIVADLDREPSSKNSLTALIVCLGRNGWMVLMAAINVAAAVSASLRVQRRTNSSPAR
jgi:hypothetical protein